MGNQVIDGLRIDLSGPTTLPKSVVSRASPTYDASRGLFTVTMTNRTDRVLVLPLDEMQRAVARVYVNPHTLGRMIDNKRRPPRTSALLESVSPGDARSFQVPFEFPERISTSIDGQADIRFCVRWEDSWLRNCTNAGIDCTWNKTFEICSDIKILMD